MSVLTWSQIQLSIQNNPYKHSSISQYIPKQDRIEGTTEQVEKDGWIKIPVSPATPLSAILLIQDCEYNTSLVMSRKAILREVTTDLQEKASQLLKGRQWPVRRTSEGLVAVGLEEGRASVWPAIGWRALATLHECQIVILNEEKQSIQFFPEDIRTWSSEQEVFFIEYECRYVWTYSNLHFAKWITDHESSGWSIDWPLADGTVQELRTALEKLNESSAGKLKEDLRKFLGRRQAIKNVFSWIISSV